MLYPKNVPNVERVLRIVLGLGLIAFAWYGQSSIAGFTMLLTGTLLFSAAFVILTGFVGWCPACAMVGRKLKSDLQPKK